MARDRWEDASAYERFMGRWSSQLGREFVARLPVPPGANWLEVGCGTGALTSAICELAAPASVVACDIAPDFVTYCRENLHYLPLSIVAVAPGCLPASPTGFDAAVSSLVLNFLPAPAAALAQMRDACSPGGCVAACVWDYSDGMEFLKIFWDAAVDLDPAARPLHEGSRFPLCTPAALRALFEAAALRSVTVAPIRIPTIFSSFDDFWHPFVDGPGPAPTYVSSLSATERERLATRLRSRLSGEDTSAIHLNARAWGAWGSRDAA